MFTPIKRRILSIFSISIMTLALLYSAVASAVLFSQEVTLDNFQNKPGWVLKNTSTRIIRNIQIPEPNVANAQSSNQHPDRDEATERSIPVTVTITGTNGESERLSLGPRDTFNLPPGATAQVIVAEAMDGDVTELWDGVDFNLARGLVNLLPSLEDLFQQDKINFAKALATPLGSVDPSIMEEGGLSAIPEERRLLEQLKQIQTKKENEVQATYARMLADDVQKREQIRKELDENVERASTAAQEEYERVAQEAATEADILKTQEREAMLAQGREPAMKGCLEEFFKICEQYDAAKKAQALEMLNLCRTSIMGSSELKRIRGELAKNKKIVDDAEIARAAAIAKAEKEAKAAKSKLEQEATAAEESLKQRRTKALEEIRANGVVSSGTPTVSKSPSVSLSSNEEPIAKEEAAAASPSSPSNIAKGRSRISLLNNIFSALDFSDKLLERKNDTHKDGDEDHQGSQVYGSSASFGTFSSTTPSSR